jgi:proline iminopeptidase
VVHTIDHTDSGVVDVEGASLPYRIEGHGPPCLVLGSVAFYTRAFSQALREHLELVFIDLRHFVPADSGPVPSQLSIDTYADDLERVRTTLGLGDVVVIGHSVHSFIALEYARRYPAHVRGVVAIGGVPSTSEAEYEAAFEQLWQTASEQRKTLRAEKQAELASEPNEALSPGQHFVREYVARGPMWWHDPTYDATWLWEGVEFNWPVFERLGGLFDLYDPAQGPGQITAPVLIAHGLFDYPNPHPLWEAHRHKLARHTLVFFEKSGHTPQLEEPERFDETLLRWVANLT